MGLKETLAVVLDSTKAAETLLDGVKEPEKALRDSDRMGCLTKKQANRLRACFALADMLNKSSELPHVASATALAEYVMPKMRHLNHEEFRMLTLNSKNRVTGEFTVTTGTLTGSMVHAREVFSKAIMNKAAAIVVVHNHPSRDPHPSQEDDKVTAFLVNAGKILAIPLLDHIIIGDNTYYSYAEAKRCGF